MRGKNQMDKKNQIIREAELIKFKPVVESGEAMKSSAFKSVYQNVAKELEKICKEQQSIIDDEKKKSEIVFKKGKSQPNIIMLHGDRGSGKTSCMISIVNELVKDKSERKLFENINVESFKTIELIDPSEFEEESNILHIIIGELFKRFKGDVENGNKQISQDDKRLIIKKFEEIFDAIKVLSKNKSLNGDSQLDYLIEMSDALNLSDKINVLIKEYLRIIYDSEGTQRLIIPIDDMDLNSKYAYQMLEQIRKYFMIPRVVFIIASKLEQLKLDIKQNFYKDYEEIIKQENNFDVVVDEMASKYIEKLIPASRRIELPSLYEIIGDQVKLEIAKDDELELEEYLITKIYDKTHIYFKKGELYPSRIVPENLREFGGLINLLNNMCDSREERVQNREQFKKYFLNSWISTHLSTGKARIVNEIYTKPVKEKNKFVVQALEKELKFLARIQQKEKDGTATRKYDPTVAKLEYLKIIDEENYAKAISLGDILLVLSFADQYLISKEDLDFTFAVRTVYSFNLLDEYQKIKDREKEDNNEVKSQIITGYDHLINGSVKNTAVYKFFNYGKDFKITDDMKFTDYSLTQKYIHFDMLMTPFKISKTNDLIEKSKNLSFDTDALKSCDEKDISDAVIMVEKTLQSSIQGKDVEIKTIEECSLAIMLIVSEMIFTMIIDQTGSLRDREREDYRRYCNNFSKFNRQSIEKKTNTMAFLDIIAPFSFLYHTDIEKTTEYYKFIWGDEKSIHDMFEKLLGPLSLKKMLKGTSDKKFYIGNIEAIEEVFSQISNDVISLYNSSWIKKLSQYFNCVVNNQALNNKIFDAFKEIQYLNVWNYVLDQVSQNNIRDLSKDYFDGKNAIKIVTFVENIFPDMKKQDLLIKLEKSLVGVKDTSNSGIKKEISERVKAVNTVYNQIIDLIISEDSKRKLAIQASEIEKISKMNLLTKNAMEKDGSGNPNNIIDIDAKNNFNTSLHEISKIVQEIKEEIKNE